MRDFSFVGVGEPIPEPTLSVVSTSDAAVLSVQARQRDQETVQRVVAEIREAYPDISQGVVVRLNNIGGAPMLLGYETALAAILRGNAELIKPQRR